MKTFKVSSMKSLATAMILVGFASASAYVQADNTASAYTADGMVVIGAGAYEAGAADETGWARVLSTTLQNSGTPKDLVIGLSFETMLFTKTMVQSREGSKSTSIAEAEIEMYVLVDGKEALPGKVMFDRRYQELWAKLGGVLDCSDLNGDGIISFDECTLTDEEIGLILDTKAAHTFNFLAYNIGSGSHTIEAYARLKRNGSVAGSGATDANAALGKGTLSVWEVHGSNVTR
jgi:hypothetical protein